MAFTFLHTADLHLDAPLRGALPAALAGRRREEIRHGLERVVDEEYLQGELGKGLHAASDHYEDAMVSGVVTVGSRRCGGGMAGEPFVTNCAEAAAVEPADLTGAPPRLLRMAAAWTP